MSRELKDEKLLVHLIGLPQGQVCNLMLAKMRDFNNLIKDKSFISNHILPTTIVQLAGQWSKINLPLLTKINNYLRFHLQACRQVYDYIIYSICNLLIYATSFHKDPKFLKIINFYNSKNHENHDIPLKR